MLIVNNKSVRRSFRESGCFLKATVKKNYRYCNYEACVSLSFTKKKRKNGSRGTHQARSLKITSPPGGEYRLVEQLRFFLRERLQSFELPLAVWIIYLHLNGSDLSIETVAIGNQNREKLRFQLHSYDVKKKVKP